jgi:hypothetical protein
VTHEVIIASTRAYAKTQIEARTHEILILHDATELDYTTLASPSGDLVKMGQPTVALPPPNEITERNKSTLDALDNKPGLFKIQETRIGPKGSLYAIEMLVAPSAGDVAPKHADFRPRAIAINRDSQPFLKVQPGEVVAVRIINESPHDAASTVTIDGLSMFTFREDKANRNEHVVVKKGTAGDVLGWFRNTRISSAFLVAELPKNHAKAALLKDPAKIGAITVTFAAASEKDSQRPTDEIVDNRKPRTEIVPGGPIEAPYETVRRQIGDIRAVGTVRYDKR